MAIDVTSNESIQAGIKAASEVLGVIDFAVNTAGITGPMLPIHELDDEQYYKITRIDMDGCFKFMKYIIQYFRAQEPRFVRHDEGIAWEPVYQRGSLVNLASSIATVCQPLLGAYCEPTMHLSGLWDIDGIGQRITEACRVNRWRKSGRSFDVQISSSGKR